MWVKRVGLKNFKRLADFEARFCPGMNVVKGPLNELGKSTLLDGIIVALFQNPKSTARELKDYASWGSARQFRTSIEFEDGGRAYLLEKDFGKGTVRLTAAAEQDIDTLKEVSAKVAELLGTSSDRLFLCSSCIRQSEITKVSSGEKEINESLEEIVSGGKESALASQVIAKLDSRIAEARKGQDRPAKNPGVLQSLKNTIQAALQRYSEVKGEVSEVEARKMELVQVTRQLADVREQRENAGALLEKNRLRKEIEASIQSLTKNYDGVEKLLSNVKMLREDSERADRALSAAEGFRDKQQISELRRELDAVRNKRDIIEKDLAQRERELAEAVEKLGKRKSVTFLGSAKGLAAAAAMLAGGVAGVIIGPLYFLSLIIAGAGLLAAATRARSSLDRDKHSIADIEKRIRDMKEGLDDISKEEHGVLAGAECGTYEEFNEKEKAFYGWLDKKNSADLQLRGMLGGRTVEELEEQKLELARKLATEETKLTDDLKQTHLSPEEYVALERKVANLQQRQAELERQKNRCEAIVEKARFTVEDRIRLEEELEGLRDDLKREEKKVKAYALAREFISRARTDTLSSAGEALEKGIGTYLAVFTNGKYKQVKVNKEALEFQVYSDEKGDWARVDPKSGELSGGVIDEFYLAFRLALARLIFGDKKPPLILDDPFVNFDAVRLANTLKFFKTLASEHQVIIFTLSDVYDKVADKIILLGEKERLL
jgi:DNA repair exonuclease SbcCD ATPase subunit